MLPFFPLKTNYFPVLSTLGFSGSSVVKNLPANAGDTGSIPGSERSPGGGNGLLQTHSNILVWKIRWAEEPGGYNTWGHKESDRLSDQACTHAFSALINETITCSDTLESSRSLLFFHSFFIYCSVSMLCPTLCNCIYCSTPGVPVLGCELDPWVGKIPWRRAWQPTPVFLPRESHGQRRLAGIARSWTKLKLLSTHACTFVGKVMSLPFNMLSRFVIAFLPRSKHFLISWLQSLSSNFGAQRNKVCHRFHFFPFYLSWSDGNGCHNSHLFSVLFHPHQEAL